MRAAALFLILAAAPAGADTWLALDGAGAEAALAARVIAWEGGALQDFLADGRTLYAADPGSGVHAWGRWMVQGDRVCTAWPPSEGWRCYRVERALDRPRLRFTADDGARVTATYTDLR